MSKPRRQTRSAQKSGTPAQGVLLPEYSEEVVKDIITIDDFPEGIPERDRVRAILSGTGLFQPSVPKEQFAAGVLPAVSGQSGGRQVVNSWRAASSSSPAMTSCVSNPRKEMLKGGTESWYSMKKWQTKEGQRNWTIPGQNGAGNIYRTVPQRYQSPPIVQVQKGVGMQQFNPQFRANQPSNVTPRLRQLAIRPKPSPPSGIQMRRQMGQFFPNPVPGSVAQKALPQGLQNIFINHPNEVNFTQMMPQSMQGNAVLNRSMITGQPAFTPQMNLTPQMNQMNILGNSNLLNINQTRFSNRQRFIPSNTLSMASLSHINTPPQKRTNLNFSTRSVTANNENLKSPVKRKGHVEQPSTSPGKKLRSPRAGTLSYPYIIEDEPPPVMSPHPQPHLNTMQSESGFQHHYSGYTAANPTDWNRTNKNQGSNKALPGDKLILPASWIKQPPAPSTRGRSKNNSLEIKHEQDYELPDISLTGYHLRRSKRKQACKQQEQVSTGTRAGHQQSSCAEFMEGGLKPQRRYSLLPTARFLTSSSERCLQPVSPISEVRFYFHQWPFY